MHTRKKNREQVNMVTLGCSKNTVDSEVLMRQLEANGLEFVHNSGSFDAKTVIINTCGFIRDAKQESVDTILRFIRAKQEGQISNVVVMGCLSERYKKDLEIEIPDVDKYFGTNNIEAIINHLGLSYKKELLGDRVLTTPGHYAYVKISEGCDRRCAFCAIPLIRGKYVSKPVENVLQEAVLLAGKGVKELILIAQDLTWYGMDLYKQQKLPELLRQLSEIPGIGWIRLHYAYPAGFPLEIIDIMKERENMCRYLDIPFQHISDRVLQMMRRGHTKRQNYELIDHIRKQIPGIALRTTLLTGHPGEGKKEFAELRDFVREVRFDRLGVFTYSEEEDTWAAGNYKDTLSEGLKKDRADELMAIQQDISKELNDKKLGNLIKVLIDSREGEYYVGRSEADSPEVDNEVLIPVAGNELNIGMFYTVQITRTEDFDLFGEVMEKL